MTFLIHGEKTLSSFGRGPRCSESQAAGGLSEAGAGHEEGVEGLLLEEGDLDADGDDLAGAEVPRKCLRQVQRSVRARWLERVSSRPEAMRPA
jgi:hypothetical protein